eukprot:1146357-Pelagomonas_calceolata.AAC.5
MAQVRAVHFVFMYLILSTTKMVVLGQKAAFKNAGLGADSGSFESEDKAQKGVEDAGSVEQQQQSATTQDDQAPRKYVQASIHPIMHACLLQDVAAFLSRLGLFGSSRESAADGMTTSGGNGTDFRGSAFSEDGTALNEDISFLLRMANQTGAEK